MSTLGAKGRFTARQKLSEMRALFLTEDFVVKTPRLEMGWENAGILTDGSQEVGSKLVRICGIRSLTCNDRVVRGDVPSLILLGSRT